MTKKATCERWAVIDPNGAMIRFGSRRDLYDWLELDNWYGSRAATLRQARRAGYRVVKVRVTEIGHRRTKTIARLLREYRVEAGETQREAAKHLGITNIHLCNLERGESRPSFALLDRIESVYGRNPYIEMKIGTP